MPSRGIRILLIALAVSVVGAAGAAGIVYFTLLRNLPEMNSVAEYQPPLTSRVLDRNGRLIGEFYDERRMLVPYEAIPRHVVLAFVAGEDAAFFHHEGLDYMGILRAAWVNLAAGGAVKQGGSTITQQTVKGLLLTPERKIQRKIKEMILARRLEQKLSKEDILWLYLNQIYFGQGAWGIGEASRTYYGKHVSELTVSEAALLAGLPQRPSEYSPTSNPRAAERRRRYVLQRMRVEGFVDEETFRNALDRPPTLQPPKDRVDARVAAYFVEEVRRRLYDTVGSEQVLRGGLTIETTLDLDLQREATAAVTSGLDALDHRQGWRGPEKQASPDDLEGAVAEVAEANGLVARPEVAAAGEEPPGNAELPEELEPEVAEPEPPKIPVGEPLRGVVVEVDQKGDTAKVAFSPDFSATVKLKDVRWARRPDPAKRPRSVRHIEEIFQLGQVARFEVLPGPGDEEGVAATGRALFATLRQTPLAEGALLSFDVDTGAVRALVGGYDYRRSEFDRATQARRQAGSAFKPIIYAAALDKDYTPASILVDRPVVYEDPESGFVWRPQNYSRKFLGRLPMRQALARSVNNATIHLFRDLKVNYVIEFSRRLGVESPLARDLSLALGSSSVTLLEMTRAYAVFAAYGKQVLPVFLTSVLDREGAQILGPQILGTVPEVEEWRPEEEPSGGAEPALVAEEPEADGAEKDDPLARRKQVISPQLAWLATDLLRAAVFDPNGTGRGARELRKTVGGKTGTTNFGGDAWFVGYSPDIVTGVWVGYDEKRVLGKGETGGRTALPIWRAYMKHALSGRSNRDFSVPGGIVFARVDPETGMLAGAGSENAYLQGFAEGTEPTQTARSSTSGSGRGKLLRLDQF